MPETDQIKLEESWKKHLADEFQKPTMANLKAFLKDEHKKEKRVFPPGPLIFNALNTTPFDQVKVVIIGQDPYHGAGQAHGLSFSVQQGTSFPPSLQNIFKEMQSDLGFEKPKTGDLTQWAKQGVLLLNAVLTVEEGHANSHQGKGWETFTDAVIRHLNEERQGIVFVLWGSYAQKKGAIVDRKKHFVIESAHPSPLSSYRGFFGSKPFSKINQYLEQTGQSPINWNLQG